jgi:hypothetical protein
MKRLNVLFIGNSFTARNDLPHLVAHMADAAGAHLDHELLSIGGASLRTHWNKGEATKRIASGKFDYVVLQEQSTLPIKNPLRMRENVLLFDAAIRKAKSKTALYMTWARAHAPATQALITQAYTTIGKEIAATIIPAGLAWQRALAEPKHPVLHDRDGSHPTLAGSYLAACTAFEALFKVSAVGNDADVSDLSDSDCADLQRAAHAVKIRNSGKH